MKYELCKSYKHSLKTAIDHTKKVFAKMDKCKLEEVEPFHPSEYELTVEQKELFND